MRVIVLMRVKRGYMPKPFYNKHLCISMFCNKMWLCEFIETMATNLFDIFFSFGYLFISITRISLRSFYFPNNPFGFYYHILPFQEYFE
jgi:hypothetical protein